MENLLNDVANFEKVKGTVLGLRQFLAAESPLQMMKNVFLFHHKNSWGFVHVKNGWIRKARLISNIMTSQPEEHTIAIHILSNISKSKSKQTMEFGQLLKYNMRNTFFE